MPQLEDSQVAIGCQVAPLGMVCRLKGDSCKLPTWSELKNAGGVSLGSLRGKARSGESHEAAALHSKSCSIPTVHIAFRARPQSYPGD